MKWERGSGHCSKNNLWIPSGFLWSWFFLKPRSVQIRLAFFLFFCFPDRSGRMLLIVDRSSENIHYPLEDYCRYLIEQVRALEGYTLRTDLQPSKISCCYKITLQFEFERKKVEMEGWLISLHIRSVIFIWIFALFLFLFLLPDSPLMRTLSSFQESLHPFCVHNLLVLKSFSFPPH